MTSPFPNLRASSEIPTGFCQCGCGGKTRVSSYSDKPRGYVKGQPIRYINGHQRHSDPDSRYRVEDCGYSTPCWIWTGAKTKDGYAYIVVNGQHYRAHNFYYERDKGPIPEGLTLDHLCRNRGCMNPDHLEPVTHRENVLRGIGPTAVNARKEFCKHGHRFTPENTYLRPTGGRDCKICVKLRKERSIAKLSHEASASA